jgi:hypothetical protein
MKKLLMLTTAAFVLTAPAAFAADATTDVAKPPSKHQGMMDKIDTDHDGSISKAEFMAVQEKRFAELDTNGDGKITKEEGEAKRKEWHAKMEKMRAEKEQKAKESAPAPEKAPAQ